VGCAAEEGVGVLGEGYVDYHGRGKWEEFLAQEVAKGPGGGGGEGGEEEGGVEVVDFGEVSGGEWDDGFGCHFWGWERVIGLKGCLFVKEQSFTREGSLCIKFKCHWFYSFNVRSGHRPHLTLGWTFQGSSFIISALNR
jgi:hypothetical protein